MKGLFQMPFDKNAYDRAYQKEHTIQIKMNLVRTTDADIIDWLNAQPNKQGYLKALIRSDIEKNSR